MRCPKCGMDRTGYVVDTRPGKGQHKGSIIRRRQCCICDFRWNTEEKIMNEKFWDASLKWYGEKDGSG